jgi:disulfide bond formation protein DsbB
MRTAREGGRLLRRYRIRKDAAVARLDGVCTSGTGTMHGMQAFGLHPLRRFRPAIVAAVAIAGAGSATILGAYFFQYAMGLPPCPLCLEQRIAYYVSIPLAVLVAIGASRGAPRGLVAAGLGIVALAMTINAGLGVFHAGVEWKWWPGPQECSGPLTDLGAGGDLLSSLKDVILVRCDEAAWRFLGLSLAGYNALISLGLAAIAAWGALRTIQDRM